MQFQSPNSENTVTYSTRRDIHLPRRIFHMFWGVFFGIAGLMIDTKKDFVLFLAFFTSVSLALEFIRLVWSPFNRLSQTLSRPLLRDGEESRMTGATYYLIGCTLAALVFPRAIAVLAIFYLGIGDPVASLIGVKYGKRFIAQKSLEGSIACFSICFGLTFLLTYFLGKTESLELTDRAIFSLIGGIAAMVGEFLPLRTDDNLALPLISGAILWLTATVLHLLPGLYF